MMFRFRRRRSKDPWNYLEAKNRMEGRRLAAIALERIDFDFEAVHQSEPGPRIPAEKTVTVKYWQVAR